MNSFVVVLFILALISALIIIESQINLGRIKRVTDQNYH
jgi:hypothetical protein